MIGRRQSRLRGRLICAQPTVMALLLFVGTSLAFNSGPALRFSRLGSAQRSAAARAPLPFSVATAPDLAEKTGVPYGELTVG